MGMPVDEPFDITFYRIFITIWGDFAKVPNFFSNHVAPQSTLTVSRHINLCVSQVHEFSLMHRLNYSATKLYTVNVNYSSSNNR